MQATKVTSKVRSRIKTDHNCNEHHGSVCESKTSEHDTSGTSILREDVVHCGFVTGDNSSGTSKTSSDDSGEGKEGLHKTLSSKAEALLAKKGISWPWRGLEHYGPGKSQVVSAKFQDAQETDLTHQGVPEPILVPDCQDTECDQESKYEVTGSWWSFNSNSTSTVSSNVSTNSGLDYEADCLDYEILWQDLIIGEQVGQGICFSLWKCSFCLQIFPTLFDTFLTITLCSICFLIVVAHVISSKRFMCLSFVESKAFD